MASRSVVRVKRKSHGLSPQYRRDRRQPSQREFYTQDRQRLTSSRRHTLKLDVTTLHGISFFNQDLEAAPPADWVAFREKLQKSNGVLFVTPEYNRSISGVLKNAIDVGSRPYGKSSFNGKPTGIVSNSPGPLGGVSAAKHLQNILPGISRPDPAAAGNLSERRRRCVRRQGRTDQGTAAEGARSNISTPSRPTSQKHNE